MINLKFNIVIGKNMPINFILTSPYQPELVGNSQSIISKKYGKQRY